jgi:uncharacterized membrane protein HdeD (DUF308 family)
MVAPEDDFPARPEHRDGRALLTFAQAAQDAAELLRDRRLSLALRSAASVLFGMAFLWPDLPTSMIPRLFAAYVLVDGILALLPGGWGLPYRLGWPLLIGGCIDLAGAGAVYVWLWSGMNLAVFADIAMLWAMASGVALTLAGATLREWDTDHLLLVGGIASLVFARALLSQLATDPVVLSAWMGLFALTMAVLFLKLTLKHCRLMLL